MINEVVFPQHGMTALIWASGRGHTEVVNHLLEAGANPDAADKVRDARECEGAHNGRNILTQDQISQH